LHPFVLTVERRCKGRQHLEGSPIIVAEHPPRFFQGSRQHGLGLGVFALTHIDRAQNRHGFQGSAIVLAVEAWDQFRQQVAEKPGSDTHFAT
jgi:hypothetical protein